jgi:hypothetical protein
MTLLASPNLCLQDEEQQLKRCSFAYLTCVTCLGAQLVMAVKMLSFVPAQLELRFGVKE